MAYVKDKQGQTALGTEHCIDMTAWIRNMRKLLKGPDIVCVTRQLGPDTSMHGRIRHALRYLGVKDKTKQEEKNHGTASK